MAFILVIDDDAAFRDSTQTLLGLDGHEVTEARNGREGEAAIRRRRPDLVILDIFMPEQDGLETIRNLRGSHPGLKILAISGGGDLQLERALAFAREFGADDVLSKPIPRDGLRAAVRALVNAPAQPTKT